MLSTKATLVRFRSPERNPAAPQTLPSKQHRLGLGKIE